MPPSLSKPHDVINRYFARPPSNVLLFLSYSRKNLEPHVPSYRITCSCQNYVHWCVSRVKYDCKFLKDFVYFFKYFLRRHSPSCRYCWWCVIQSQMIPADERYPDCPFVEDAVVYARGTAVTLRQGHGSRRGEVDAVRCDLITRGSEEARRGECGRGGVRET